MTGWHPCLLEERILYLSWTGVRRSQLVERPALFSTVRIGFKFIEKICTSTIRSYNFFFSARRNVSSRLHPRLSVITNSTSSSCLFFVSSRVILSLFVDIYKSDQVSDCFSDSFLFFLLIFFPLVSPTSCPQKAAYSAVVTYRVL